MLPRGTPCPSSPRAAFGHPLDPQALGKRPVQRLAGIGGSTCTALSQGLRAQSVQREALARGVRTGVESQIRLFHVNPRPLGPSVILTLASQIQRRDASWLNRYLKSAQSLWLPALCLCCLMLSGCGTAGPLEMEFSEDSITIDPAEVEIMPGGAPVPVTIEWKPLKETMTLQDFESWSISFVPSHFDVTFAGQNRPSTTLTVSAKRDFEASTFDLHAGTMTSEATITAHFNNRVVLNRSRCVVLVINAVIPRIKYSFIGIERKEISSQEISVKSTVAVEVVNDSTNTKYSFDIRFFPGIVNLCNPGSACSAQPLEQPPTITTRPAIPGKTGAFQFEQTVRASPPQTVGAVECNFSVSAVGEDGKGTVTGQPEKILYR
jgi:hypothetical protein